MQDIHVITPDDADFPAALRTIPDPPARLHCRGAVELLRDCSLAFSVIGTRKMTAYGEAVTRRIVAGLKTPGAVIVSGLALGVDAAAHAAALDHGIRTIAVLGGGVDDASLYPRANFRLARRILSDGGLIVSEYPPGTTARQHHFPERNRIVAGLSRALIVIEAAPRSGTSITARAALEYGKDVFAVPGDITRETSAGTNALIAGGAIPVCDPGDVAAYYGIGTDAAARREAASPRQSSILDALANGAATHDALRAATGLDAAALAAEVTRLELAGTVRTMRDGSLTLDAS